MKEPALYKFVRVSDQQSLFPLILIVTFCDKAKKQLEEAVKMAVGLLYAYFVTSGKGSRKKSSSTSGPTTKRGGGR